MFLKSNYAILTLNVIVSIIILCDSVQFDHGTCKTVDVMNNFDVSRYLGKWYEIKRYENFFESGDCVTAVYSERNSSTINVKNSQKYLENNTWTSIEGFAYLEDPSTKEGRIRVVFPTAPNPSPYWVISTDYDGYSVVYSCENISNLKIEFLWILSRTRTITEEQSSKIDKIFKEKEIGDKKFYTPKQDEQLCS